MKKIEIILNDEGNVERVITDEKELFNKEQSAAPVSRIQWVNSLNGEPKLTVVLDSIRVY